MSRWRSGILCDDSWPTIYEMLKFDQSHSSFQDNNNTSQLFSFSLSLYLSQYFFLSLSIFLSFSLSISLSIFLIINDWYFRKYWTNYADANVNTTQPIQSEKMINVIWYLLCDVVWRYVMFCVQVRKGGNRRGSPVCHDETMKMYVQPFRQSYIPQLIYSSSIRFLPLSQRIAFHRILRLNGLEAANYECAPLYKYVREANACFEKARQQRKQGKATTLYHLSKYLQRDKTKNKQAKWF